MFIIHADISEELEMDPKGSCRQAAAYVHNYACSTTKIQHKVHEQNYHKCPHRWCLGEVHVTGDMYTASPQTTTPIYTAM